MIIANDKYLVGNSRHLSHITQETYAYHYNDLVEFQKQLTKILLEFGSYGGISFFEYFPYGYIIYYYNKDGERFTNDEMLLPTFSNKNHVLLRARQLWQRIENNG